jgi:hypothetical protein
MLINKPIIIPQVNTTIPIINSLSSILLNF